MKQILFITHSLYAGGAEKALIELLKAFDYSRYRVSLCLLYNEGEYLSDIPQEVEVLTLFEKKNYDYPQLAEIQFICLLFISLKMSIFE